jgi:hypothetical protein
MIEVWHLVVHKPDTLTCIFRKSVAVIAKALESMGVIGDAEKWLKG